MTVVSMEYLEILEEEMEEELEGKLEQVNRCA